MACLSQAEYGRSNAERRWQALIKMSQIYYLKCELSCIENLTLKTKYKRIIERVFAQYPLIKRQINNIFEEDDWTNKEVNNKIIEILDERKRTIGELLRR